MRIRYAFVSIDCDVDRVVKENSVAVMVWYAKSKRSFRRVCHCLRIAKSALRMDFTAVPTVNPDPLLLSVKIAPKRSPRKALTN